MIELRRKLEWGLRHPLLGPVCLVLLALLLAFTVVHGAHDQIESCCELVVCIAIVFTVLVCVRPPRARTPFSFVQVPRGPPACGVAVAAAESAFPVVPGPLRL